MHPARRRLSVDLTEDQHQAIQKIFRIHGTKQTFFSYLIDDIIEIENQYPGILTSAIINRHLKLSQLSKALKEELDAKTRKL